MMIIITNSKNDRCTSYTELDIEEEVRLLRKRNGVQQRCTVTLMIDQDGGSPVLTIRDIHGNTGATVI